MLSALVLVAAGALGASTPQGHVASPPFSPAQMCAGSFPGHRNPQNPLMLSESPGPNPLTGARLFVNGPRHGSAAGAIVSLLGIDPAKYPDNYSFSALLADLISGRLTGLLAVPPALRAQVALLSKIAAQPEPQRFSPYSAGGGPGKVLDQVQKLFCYTLTADPGAIPLITTYFLYQAGGCESHAQILAHRATFQRQVRELAEGIGRRPAVVLMELDAIGASGCMARTGALGDWEANIRYEIDQVSRLPHAVAYIEAGYSDANSVAYTVRALRAVGIGRIRGFYTNDTHNQWPISEIRWARRIEGALHGSHAIVITGTTGRGPRLNPDPVHQGIEDLCNAPGRGLGIPPTTHTGFSGIDAFAWSAPPGNSAGGCHGGPSPGTFWVARALGLASRAQAKLGPAYPNNPY